jgi:uncharacterized protein
VRLARLSKEIAQLHPIRTLKLRLIRPRIAAHGADMKYMVLIAALSTMTAASVSAQHAPVPAVAEAPIQFGTSYTLPAATLGDMREINVWLPAGYERSQDRYPVIYVLDGALDQDFQHIAGLGHLASISWTFGPMIIVGVQTRNRTAELTPRATDPRYLRAWPDSGGAERFRRFLDSEVIPFVEGRFRTGERRALMGESLAGLFVVNTLLNQPALFNDYVAISPSLWWDDRRAFRALNQAAALPHMRGRRLYLAMADEGGTMQDGVDQLRTWLATLPEGIIELRYADHSRIATHATIYHRAAEEALRWLYPQPPYGNGERPWYMIDGAEPPPPPPAP